MAESRDPALRVLPGQRQKDQPDWETVYREHVEPIYRYVFARCGTRHDAEDITSQVFLQSLPRLRCAAADGEVRAYLLTSARTVVADFWRARYAASWVEFTDDFPDASPDPDHNQARHEAQVAMLLRRLPERQRRVLELRFLRGYSLKETASTLGISVANAKVVQWRALRRAAGLEDDAT